MNHENPFKNMPQESKDALINILRPVIEEGDKIELRSMRIYTQYQPTRNEIRFDVADRDPNRPGSGWLPSSVGNLTIEDATALRDKLNELLIEAQLAN